MVAVIDGKESSRFDSIESGSLVFSPDSSQVAFIISKGTDNIKKYQVVLNVRRGNGG
jgi:hypothetical protein